MQMMGRYTQNIIRRRGRFRFHSRRPRSTPSGPTCNDSPLLRRRSGARPHRLAAQLSGRCQITTSCWSTSAITRHRIVDVQLRIETVWKQYLRRCHTEPLHMSSGPARPILSHPALRSGNASGRNPRRRRIIIARPGRDRSRLRAALPAAVGGAAVGTENRVKMMGTNILSDEVRPSPTRKRSGRNAAKPGHSGSRTSAAYVRKTMIAGVPTGVY